MVDAESEADRSRGILSPADREFLLASADQREEHYSRQARSKRKRAIRERFRDAVYDVSLLLEFWPADQRGSVIEELLDDWRGREGLADLIALCALELVPRDQFDELFGRGVYRAESRRQDDRDSGVVHVRSYDDIVESVDRAAIEEAIAVYAAGDRGIWDLSDVETRILALLLEFEDLDDSMFDSMLSNVERAMFELAGGKDSMRRGDWRESLHYKHGRREE